MWNVVQDGIGIVDFMGGTGLTERLEPEARQEFEQAVLRLTLALLLAVYLHGLQRTLHFTPDLGIPLLFAAGYILFSLLNLAGFLLFPKPAELRKGITLIGDTLIVLYGLYWLGEHAMPLYAILLLISTGYGLRFGVRYLYAAALLANLGFLVVIETAAYWQTHIFLGYSLLCANTLVPLSLARLLKRQLLARQYALTDVDRSGFLADMSHEIRTPLTGIIGVSELMLSEPHDAATINKLKTIERSSKHLMGIINDMLDFTTIEVGCLSMEEKTFDLHAVFSSVIKAYKPIAVQKGIRFHANISPDIPYSLVGDQLRVKQVLMNLVGNAVKLTVEGYVEVRINLLANYGTAVKLRFEISDTGVDVPETRLTKLCKRFIGLDTPNKWLKAGKGLGTAVANDLIKLMGGEIYIDQDADKGNRLYFDLAFDSLLDKPFERFEGRSAITISGRASFERAVSKYLAAWGISNLQLLTERDAIAHIIHLPHSAPLPFIIIDEASLRQSCWDFCKRLKGLTKAELRTILVTAGDSVPAEYYRMDVYAFVTELHNARQFNNAIHHVLVDDDATEGTEPLAKGRAHGQQMQRQILVAEDIEVNRYVLREVLVRAGYNVVTTHNGRQALECLEEEAFDLCIVDMQMPEMTGIEVVNSIKQGHGANRGTPFIVLTADATQVARNQCAAAKVDAYLTKPIDMPLLLETIDSLIGDGAVKGETEVAVNSDMQMIQEEEIVNQQVLDQLCRLGNSPDFIKQLVDHFQFDTDNLINSMHFSLRGQRYRKLIDEAHGVKGAAGNIGANKLADTAQRINMATPETLEREGAQLLKQLKTDFADTIKSMRAYCERNT